MATELIALQRFTIAKEKLPNLPNLPKYDNVFLGIVGESRYETRNRV
jgi:hypothetical protein